jgi:hypothetical protein
MDFPIKSPMQRRPSDPKLDVFSAQVPLLRGQKAQTVPLNDTVEGAAPTGMPHARPILRAPKQARSSLTALLDNKLHYLRPMFKRCAEKTESALHLRLRGEGGRSAADMVERLTYPEMRKIMKRYQLLCSSMGVQRVPPDEQMLGTLVLGVLAVGEESAEIFVNFLLPLICEGDPPQAIIEILAFAMTTAPSQRQSFVDVVAKLRTWADNTLVWNDFVKCGQSLWLQAPERCTQSLADLTLLMTAHRSGLSDEEAAEVIGNFGRANNTPGGSDALRRLVDQLCRYQVRRGGDPIEGPTFGQSLALLSQYTSAELQLLEAHWLRCKSKGYKGFQFRSVWASLMSVTLSKRQALCDHVLYFADSSMTKQQIKKLFELFAEHNTVDFIDQAMPLRDKFRGAKRITHLFALTNKPIHKRAAYIGCVPQGTDTAVIN